MSKAIVVAAVFVLVPGIAHAAPTLDGTAMAWPWALPFVGLLLSIAAGPLLFPKIWHDHHGKFAFVWSVSTLAPLAAAYGVTTALAAFVHAALAEYMSFIILLFALYVVAGGIVITTDFRGGPTVNTAMLAIGSALASVIGTTGAAMVLIRPLLRANIARARNVHVIVFFIFLVANIGGALSPLGDPPLLIGFLHGIDFFWTTKSLWLPTALAVAIVLAIFFALDLWCVRKESSAPPSRLERRPHRIRLSGRINILLLALVIAAILLSAVWQPGVTFDVQGTVLELQNLARDAALIVIALVSLWLTPDEHRRANGFSWTPILEVVLLFAGIFVTVIPVLAMLQAGTRGPFSWLVGAVTAADGGPHQVAYFWLTGVLSAFLDNAPTYLVFFELAGGDAAKLMGPLASTLAAISMGAVYMGALTYIGNAPNFMIYAIASEQGVKMPSFFGYLLWSCVVLLPVFALLTFAFVA